MGCGCNHSKALPRAIVVRGAAPLARGRKPKKACCWACSVGLPCGTTRAHMTRRGLHPDEAEDRRLFKRLLKEEGLVPTKRKTKRKAVRKSARKGAKRKTTKKKARRKTATPPMTRKQACVVLCRQKYTAKAARKKR